MHRNSTPTVKKVHAPALLKAIGAEMVKLTKQNMRVKDESDDDDDDVMRGVGPRPLAEGQDLYQLKNTTIAFGEVEKRYRESTF